MQRVLVQVAFIVACASCNDRGVGERARLFAMRPMLVAAVKAERCPRPALRTPTTGNGTTRLQVFDDPTSAVRRCVELVKQPELELGPCNPETKCAPQTFAQVKRHDDVDRACAPLFAAISENAHTSEACSPADRPIDDRGFFSTLAIASAVRLHVAPLVEEGHLAEAGEHVLDALRFTDDLGRKHAMLGIMASLLAAHRMSDMLEQIAIDPRLTAAEARAIARDLDVLLASQPRFDDASRQEQAMSEMRLGSSHEDAMPTLAAIETQARAIRRVCSGALHDCVQHLDEIEQVGVFDYSDYARRVASHDFVLSYVRMQIELRLAAPEACADPERRRAILAPWADHAVVGDGPQPLVTPPGWQVKSEWLPSPYPRFLHCVPATL